MVSLRRILAESSRNLTRGTSLALITAYVAASSVVAVVAPAGFGFEFYLKASFLTMPLVLLPFSAHLMARDRATRMADALSASPLRPYEAVAGKAACVGVLLLAGLVTQVALAATVATAHGPGALHRVASFIPWSLGIGAVSALTGLCLGAFLGDRSTAAAAASSLLALLMYVGATGAEDAVRATERLGLPAAWIGLLHLSPVVIAYDGLLLHQGIQLASGTRAAWYTLAVLLASTGTAASLVATRLQSHVEWRHPLSSPVMATAAVLGLVVAAITASTVISSDYLPNPPATGASSHRGSNLTLKMDLDIPTSGDSNVLRLGGDQQAELVFLVEGEPGRTFFIDVESITAEDVDVRMSAPYREVVLDQRGTAIVPYPLQLGTRYLPDATGATVPMVVDLRVAGESITLVTPLTFVGDGLPVPRIVGTGTLATLVSASAAWLIPRRLNR